MARRCEICGKGIEYGNQVSHSNRKSRRIWSPNLQRVRAVTDRGVRRIRVCTTCLASACSKANNTNPYIGPIHEKQTQMARLELFAPGPQESRP